MPDYTKEQLQMSTILIKNRDLKPSYDTRVFDVDTGEEITNISRIKLDIVPERNSIVAEVTFRHNRKYESTQEEKE